MKCKQVQAALAIAPSEWSETERQQIEVHVPTCATCAAIARDYAQQAQHLTALPRPSLSMAQQQAILAQVLRAPLYPWSRRLVNAFGAAAGVLILGVLVAALLWAFNNPTSLSLTATVTSVLTPTMTSTPTLGSTSPTPAQPTLFPRQPTPRPTSEAIQGAYEAIPGPGFLPYVFVLTSTIPNLELPDRRYQIGQIEVFPKGSTTPAQVLSVEFHRPEPIRPGLESEWLKAGLRIEDVNFDGYSDISIYEIGGAEWGYHHWWLFDKDTGRFYTNTLTSELNDLQPGGIPIARPLYIDPVAKEIHVNTLFATCLSTYVYEVVQEHLVLKSKWEYKRTRTCDLVTETNDLTATVTAIPAVLPATATAAPTEPPLAPPSPAPPATVMLPDGSFATATPVTPDPDYATQEAAYQATINASRATLIARATASPFPTAGPSTVQIERDPASAVTERGGLSLEMSLPKLSYLAGESGLAEITLRNHTAETAFVDMPVELVVLDEHGQTPKPWPWSPVSFPGMGRRGPGKIEAGQIVTATISFRVPPLDQAQGHQFSLWVETLYRLSVLPDIPGDISLHFEAGPLPLQVTAPNVAQQLKANLQLDQTGWHIQVTDQEGRLPVGAPWGHIEALFLNGAMSGPLPESQDGQWSGEWNHPFTPGQEYIVARVWVAAPGYVTAAVTQTLPADSPSAELNQRFGAWELPAPHAFVSLEEAQAALHTAIYHPARLPVGAALEEIVQQDMVADESQRRVNLAQVYRLPAEVFLTLNQQSTTEDTDVALWGMARYAPDAQLVSVNDTTGYLIQRFGFWLLEWKANDQVFELRTPVSAISLEQLLDIAAGVQPLR